MEGFYTVRTLARHRHDEACAAAGGKKSALDRCFRNQVLVGRQ